ncbi:hypothetical protein LTR28_003829 [Elasticomyces elasticus]|nr:hypothetical protein LTR28_003829 [Elasticomyces elasticus]
MEQRGRGEMTGTAMPNDRIICSIAKGEDKIAMSSATEGGRTTTITEGRAALTTEGWATESLKGLRLSGVGSDAASLEKTGT